MHLGRQLLGLSLSINTLTTAALVTEPGDVAVIPSWNIQSSEKAGADLETLSFPGVDTTTWHQVGVSRCTLLGCLIEAGVYREDGLFFSNALEKFNSSQFKVPWIYRQEFTLDPPEPGRHYQVVTHGITSRADIYVNGQEIANSKVQAGAYVGNSYDVTQLAKETNAIAVRVYPTDYNYDFALGFVGKQVPRHTRITSLRS